MKYQPIIGLEVHVELGTKSKMFCGCPADHFGKEPNTQTCPVCLALPGALPVPNKKAIEWTILLGLALGCKINEVSKFDRKNYFYPDLPKGYQITQYDQPFCEWGTLSLGHSGGRRPIESTKEDAIASLQHDNERIIRIRRVHLEEDTGKLQHSGGETLIDFNRSGVPLVEIVTEPDFRTIEEVDIYLKKLQRIIRYLGISTADMEKGSMRLEPSISLAPVILEGAKRPIGSTKKMLSSRLGRDSSMTTDGLELPNYRVELKNINSFRFVRKALEYEIERQKHEEHKQETRGWSEGKNATFLQREKEEAHDYRYFPEPDIPPIKFKIQNSKLKIPELPDAKIKRFIEQYKLSDYQANILCDDRKVADDFENKTKENKNFSAIDIANSIINKRPLMIKSTGHIDEEIVRHVLTENARAVSDYKSGKIQILGFLIGQCAKLMTDVDKNMIKNKLEEVLKNERKTN